MSTKIETKLNCIGDRIKSYRKKKGLTLVQLSELIELSHGSLSGLENNKSKPSADTLVSFCWHTDINIEWLLTGKGADIKEGPKRLSEASGINPLLVEVNEWLNEEEKQKDADFRTLFQQQMIRAFFDYEKWVKKRKMPLGSIPVNPKLRLS